MNTHLMLCDHKKTKLKLISWAIDYRGKHEQGFKVAKCCKRCGCLIDNFAGVIN